MASRERERDDGGEEEEEKKVQSKGSDLWGLSDPMVRLSDRERNGSDDAACTIRSMTVSFRLLVSATQLREEETV